MIIRSYKNISRNFPFTVTAFAKNITFAPGELAEWSNAVVLKTIDPSRDPRVRIPYSPQKETHNESCGFCFLWRHQTCLIFDIKNKTQNPR